MESVGPAVLCILLCVLNLLNKVYGSLFHSLISSFVIVLIAICDVKVLVYYYKNLIKVEK